MPAKRITLVENSIDGAAEWIIHRLEDTDKGDDVIYFHGWGGWGASAVLKEVVKRLRSSLGSSAHTGTEGGLEKIIHVDFSRWQSKRDLQKAIAKELELPEQVMAIFDQRDEEDDFDGVEQSARGVIPHVNFAIMKELSDCRFLVVLHNRSGIYIDLWEIGVPVIGQLSKRVLWTSRGWYCPHVTTRHREEDDLDVELAGLSDVAIRTKLSSLTRDDDVRRIQYEEIKEIAKSTFVLEPHMSPNIVTECLLYMATRHNDHNISWESHASNYWVCDGIIHDANDGGRSAWEISDDLQRNMNLDLCNICAEGICQLWRGKQHRHIIDRWVSATSQNSKEVQVPPKATSFFWTAGPPSTSTGHHGTMILENGMFEHSDRTSSLRVIHLSHCTFSFSSPPFLGCNNLRFLLIDHCEDKDDAQDGGEENNSCNHHSHHSQEDGGAWFQNLWVLEISYTDWYWLLSKDRLDDMANLRELNVKGVSNQSISHLHRCSGAGSNSHKVVKLRVLAKSYKDEAQDGPGGDRIIQQVSPTVVTFPDLSSWHILKTIILDGCGDLEIIGPDALPLSLEIFSLIGDDTTKIKSISFQGHTQLKSFLLRGLFHRLEELNMSGTSIKTLDLSAAHAEGLKRLFLLGCEKLHAILWHPQEKENKVIEVLRTDISTHATGDREDKYHKQESTSSDNKSVGWSPSATQRDDSRALTGLDWYISLRDARIFRSLLNLRYDKFLHVEISSAADASTKQGGNSDSGALIGKQQVRAVSNLYYDDDIISTFGSNSQSGGGANNNSNGYVFEAASVMRNKWIWPCPPIPEADDWPHCYISIQDDEKDVELLRGTTSTRQLPIWTTTLPGFVSEDSKTLHLHDSLSITCLPGPTPADARDLEWKRLKWCRLERCPGLEGVVFTTPSRRQLVDAIFKRLETFWASQLLNARYIWDWSTLSAFWPEEHSFKNLMFLHLDYCPRLVHVLPLYESNTSGCGRLETIEIVCCGDLKEIFPSYSDKELFPSDSESQQEAEPRKFPRLKRIHLYDLPKLQRICGCRMLAPRLKAVKVRGCWSLERLPAVVRDEATESSSEEESSEDMAPLRTVDLDCEKDWWDNLEWDGEEAGHHPSQYKRTCSAYYKKKQLRASVLR